MGHLSLLLQLTVVKRNTKMMKKIVVYCKEVGKNSSRVLPSSFYKLLTLTFFVSNLALKKFRDRYVF